MENDQLFMDEAIKEALIAYDLEEVPVGCVIVIDGIIIARSHNMRVSKTSAVAHAEILAIEEACTKLSRWILDDATIYITLEPCIMCTGAIFQARIKRVVYGAKEPKFGALGSLININEIEGINHKLEVTSGINENYISSLMKNFFSNLRNKKEM